MKIADVRELLKDKRVIEEINKHLWIESQKAGYSIGIERATDEWLRLYADGWMRYHLPEKYELIKGKSKGKAKADKVKTRKVKAATKAKKTAANTTRKKAVKKK